MKCGNIEYFTYKDLDEVFDEKGNTILSMRMVSWKGDDEDKAKLELRKWIIDADGNENPNKGFAFLTEEGPNNLAEMLVRNGYGDTETLLELLNEREGIEDKDDEDKSDEFFEDFI